LFSTFFSGYGVAIVIEIDDDFTELQSNVDYHSLLTASKV